MKSKQHNIHVKSPPEFLSSMFRWLPPHSNIWWQKNISEPPEKCIYLLNKLTTEWLNQHHIITLIGNITQIIQIYLVTLHIRPAEYRENRNLKGYLELLWTTGKDPIYSPYSHCALHSIFCCPRSETTDSGRGAVPGRGFRGPEEPAKGGAEPWDR